MQVPLLVTKLNLPHLRSGLVQRPRLLSRLNESLHAGHKLLLISAPAGFGKTTLLSAWAHALAASPAGAGPDRRAGMKVAWLSLDPSDNDRSRFLAYLVAALNTVDSAVDAHTVGLESTSQLPPTSFVLTSLLNQIEGLPDFLLVLDDYHVIDAAPIHEAVAFLLEHLPSQVHLVIATRADPPFSLSRLRGRGELTELRAADLRFAPDESAAFLNQTMGLGLPAEHVAALEKRTEGWVVGLQLAALSMRGKDAQSTAAFLDALGSQRYILDYLTDEVLAQQSEEVRDFLLRTCILDRLTGELCDALSGRDDGQHMLARLEAANLFIVPLNDARRWYRYHHLFADFLRTKLDPRSQPALHLKAARWFAAHDLLPAAVEHALASGDMDEAARLIAQSAEGAFRSMSFTMLLGWLNALPDELLRVNSELATFKGVVLFLTRDYVEAGRWTQAAELGLRPDAQPSLRGRLQTLRAQIALYNDEPDSATRMAEEALALLGAGDAFFRSLALQVVGQVLQGKGNMGAAVDVYRQAVQVERQAGNQPGALQLVNLLFALGETGRRGEALALCQQAIEDGTAASGRLAPRAEIVHVAWGWLSYEGNELGPARQRAERALDFSRRSKLSDIVFLSYYLLAQVHLASGEIEAMMEDIRQVRQYAAGLHLELPYEPWLAALEGQSSLYQGDLMGAQRWADANGLSAEQTPDYWAEPLYSAYVRLLLAQDHVQEAGTLLASMEASAKAGGRQRRLITVYLQQALLQQALGNREQALTRAADALRLAVPEGYRRAFLDESPALLEILPAVRYPALQFIDELLSAAGVQSVVQRAQPLVEPLSERELEVLQLIAAGLSNREIGQRLFIAPGTVKVHAANIYGKLGVHSRTQAVARANALGLL